jgi:hypothetical protein
MLLPLLLLVNACAMEAPLPGEDGEGEVAAAASKLAGFRNYGAPEAGIVAWNHEFNNIQHEGLLCTGTAIGQYLVLTAGHCVDEARFFYTIEENPLRVQQFGVRDRWRDPNHDVGLLRLWQPVPYWREVKEHGPVGATAAVWGFGGNDCRPDNQWEYNVGLFTKRVGFFRTQASGHIDQPIICGGDSGGPIVDWDGDGRIFGVVSRSTGTGPGGYGVFAATNLPGVWNGLRIMMYAWNNANP